MEPLSNPDTNGAEESVIVSTEVNGVDMHARGVLGVGKGVVSCLERCPQFRSVFIEREREREVPLKLDCR